MRKFAVLLVAASAVAFSQSTEGQLDFEKANRQIVRLAPLRFPQLPLLIRKELERRGCTIPQVGGKNLPHNVISGSFIKAAELDWAILCSINRSSSILIFPNASTNGVIELAQEADIDKLQSGPVTRSFIHARFRRLDARSSRGIPRLTAASNHPQSITRELTMPSWARLR